MELSEDIQNLLQKYKKQSDKCDEGLQGQGADVKYSPNDVIDVNAIDMDDHENWLQASSCITVLDLNKWLYENCSSPQTIPDTTQTPRKLFDSRTFTRPKKKLNRPSIEKYNEDYFEDEKKQTIATDNLENFVSSCRETDTKTSTPERPLHFDLSQPMSGSFFDKILSSAPEEDSFTNMSPPSLVNSMCSSTFTNLMESSYIRNDPVLREIRDADYSRENIQDTEVPLFQSLTESCSSLNSDAPETFVRKTLISLNSTYNTQSAQEDCKSPAEADDSYTENNSGDIHEIHTENIDPNITLNISHNGTYRKSNSKHNSTIEKLIDDKLNSTFNKGSDSVETFNNFDKKPYKLRETLNSTFHNPAESENNMNRRFLKEDKFEHSIDKLDMNSTYQKIPDNREQNNLNGTYRKCRISNTHKNNLDQTYENIREYKKETDSEKVITHFNDTITLDGGPGMRRLSAEIDEYLTEKMNNSYDNEQLKINNSVRSSCNSTDSLDRLSNVSNSSKGSRQMLMSEVDAIVEQQERSLQVMSTPKPAKSLTRLFENSSLSPIPNLKAKEHLSDSEISSEEYSTARKTSNFLSGRVAHSMGNLKNSKEFIKPRSINARSSNLRSGSELLQSNRTQSQSDSKLRVSCTNLKTINPNLKGSYTSLRPFSRNLPNIPSKQMDSYVAETTKDPTESGVFKVPQVPREPYSTASSHAKQSSKVSGLPRPVVSGTGIPRPTSKIPGPKTVRLSSARQITRRATSNDGFY